MKAALLVGNGLNRYSDNGPSWDALLQGIAQRHGVAHFAQTPMTLEFERMANAILKKHKNPSAAVYEELKSEIAEVLKEGPQPAAIHKQFMRLPVSDILTANYDYALEMACEPNYRNLMKRPYASAPKYSFRRLIEVGEKRFFHIHGEADKPDTLCLGYEHYAGYLEKMRAMLNKFENGAHTLQSIVNGSRVADGYWMDLFFTHNLYIVGFGLAQSEIDLWWLLTYRAYLYYSNSMGMQSHIQNRIVYYDIVKATEPENEKSKILRDMHVDYVPVTRKGENYLPAYKKIHTEIKKQLTLP